MSVRLSGYGRKSKRAAVCLRLSRLRLNLIGERLLLLSLDLAEGDLHVGGFAGLDFNFLAAGTFALKARLAVVGAGGDVAEGELAGVIRSSRGNGRLLFLRRGGLVAFGQFLLLRL